MQIVDRAWFVHNPVAIIVGCAVGYAPLDSASGHPKRKSLRIVITSIVALGKRSATKLTAPDNECFIKKPSIF